jgi:hypothetical protein
MLAAMNRQKQMKMYANCLASHDLHDLLLLLYEVLFSLFYFFYFFATKAQSHEAV